MSAAPVVAECLFLGADPLFRPSPALLNNGRGGYFADGVFVAAPGATADDLGGEGGRGSDTLVARSDVFSELP